MLYYVVKSFCLIFKWCFNELKKKVHHLEGLNVHCPECIGAVFAGYEKYT